MNTTKIKLVNELKMYLFTLILGAFAGAVIWFFLKGVSLVTVLLWERIPETVQVPWYPVALCAGGGLLIGIVHMIFGDYPEELPVVLGKIKKEKHYDYKPMAAMLIAAFLPLVFGGSVGPEAGLTGIIAGLCYWVGDNVKYARENKKEYDEIGVAVTLGMIFHAPLFGIFTVEEGMPDASDISLPRTSKLILYGSAVAAALLVSKLLGMVFGNALGGLDGFTGYTAGWFDYLLILLYVPAGILLCYVFEICEKILGGISGKIPVILREILGGLAIGAIGMLVPMVLFSGEEELGRLIENYGTYAPMFLIGIAFLKIFLTSLSIKFGFKGGHFFPLIFACVSMSFGLAMMFFSKDILGHAAFAAAMITGSTLGAQMKKPMAVSMLMLLIFPVRMLLFVFLAAAVSGRVMEMIEKRAEENKSKS